jgi:hypothetical protein
MVETIKSTVKNQTVLRIFYRYRFVGNTVFPKENCFFGREMIQAGLKPASKRRGCQSMDAEKSIEIVEGT